jgi:hypothetical protein
VESNTIVVLLTVTVILLSVVIIAMLAALTIVLIKLNHLAKRVNATADHLATATEWLSPVKVFGYASRMFRR